MTENTVDRDSLQHGDGGGAAELLELRFLRGDAGADQLQAVVDEVLGELADPASEATVAARDAGLDPDDISEAKVEVREGAQGADPFLVPIIVGITVSIGSKVAESLWKDVIWPRLRRRLGVDALKMQPDSGGGEDQ